MSFYIINLFLIYIKCVKIETSENDLVNCKCDTELLNENTKLLLCSTSKEDDNESNNSLNEEDINPDKSVSNKEDVNESNNSLNEEDTNLDKSVSFKEDQNELNNSINEANIKNENNKTTLSDTTIDNKETIDTLETNNENINIDEKITNVDKENNSIIDNQPTNKPHEDINSTDIDQLDFSNKGVYIFTQQEDDDGKYCCLHLDISGCCDFLGNICLCLSHC